MSGFRNSPWTKHPWSAKGGSSVGEGNGKLLVTGQTTSYHAGDDGDLENGLAHDFTVLDAGQYSGTSAITINGKTCNLSNNCVKDNNTDLMWARYVAQTGIGAGADGKLFWEGWDLADKTTISFDAASKEIRDSASGFDTLALPADRIFTITGSANNNNTFTVVSSTTGVIVVSETVVDEAAGATVTLATVGDLVWDTADQANANSLGGYTDWRLSNIKDLWSITDMGEGNPCLDAAIFPSTPSYYFWTSTTRRADTARAYYLSFDYGVTSAVGKKTTQYYVRLVRG